jgi:hypothetical protein
MTRRRKDQVAPPRSAQRLPVRQRPAVFLLGPILETPDGLRVEGGSVCGGLCGSQAMYIVVRTDAGYEVVGKEGYGEWVAEDLRDP